MKHALPYRFSNTLRYAAQILRLIELAVGLILAVRQGREFWITSDQRGQRLMDQGQFAEAAESFADPFRRGLAYFRAGDFKQAAQWYGGLPSAEASFNQGNALVMLGMYDDAIAQYDRALKLQPEWEAALCNREIAIGRAKRMEIEGGDMTGGKLEADGITLDKGKTSGEQTETVEGSQKMQSDDLRAIWLRQVQTTPSDFLKTKFAYQRAMLAKGDDDE